MSDFIFVNHLEQCLAHSKPYINISYINKIREENMVCLQRRSGKSLSVQKLCSCAEEGGPATDLKGACPALGAPVRKGSRIYMKLPPMVGEM